MKELDIEQVSVSQAELQLALQLIEQISEDSYDPTPVPGRGEEAHPRGHRREDRRQADRRLRARRRAGSGGQVIDLMDALQGQPRQEAARRRRSTAAPARPRQGSARTSPDVRGRRRKSAKRAAKSDEAAATPRPPKGRGAGAREGARPREVTRRRRPMTLPTFTLRRVQADARHVAHRGPGLDRRGLRHADARRAQRVPLQLPGPDAAAHGAGAAGGADPAAQDPALAAPAASATLPGELPLTGMRITAIGADVAVRDRSGHLGSGQRAAAAGLRGRAGRRQRGLPGAAPGADGRRRRRAATVRPRRRRWRAPTRPAPKRPTARRSARRPTTSTPTSISAPCSATGSATRTPSSSTSTRCPAARARPCCSSTTPSRWRSSGACASLR